MRPTYTIKWDTTVTADDAEGAWQKGPFVAKHNWEQHKDVVMCALTLFEHAKVVSARWSVQGGEPVAHVRLKYGKNTFTIQAVETEEQMMGMLLYLFGERRKAFAYQNLAAFGQKKFTLLVPIARRKKFLEEVMQAVEKAARRDKKRVMDIIARLKAQGVQRALNQVATILKPHIESGAISKKDVAGIYDIVVVQGVHEA